MSSNSFKDLIVYDDDGTPQIEICKGCRTYNICSKNISEHLDQHKIYIYLCNASSPFIEGRGICPCSDCVVKMICENPCEKYKAFTSKDISNEDYKSM